MDKQLEWIRIEPALTPEEQAQRAAMQAEIDRLNGEIREISRKMTATLTQALARRLTDVTQKR